MLNKTDIQRRVEQSENFRSEKKLNINLVAVGLYLYNKIEYKVKKCKQKKRIKNALVYKEKR